MNKLKCYFAFSDDIINNKVYTEMLETTLNSARKNTTLDLYCLYDGKKNDELYNILKKYNVNIKIMSIPFANEIYSIYTPEFMMEKFGYIISEASLRSRFLRMMIPTIETDEYILYCDTDVMFLQDISLKEFEKLPKYVGVCPEFNKNNDYSYFNAGIMLMNIPKAKEKYNEFLEMIKNKRYASIECCDQGYLNDLYKNKFDKLPLEYNWKPYWGINKNAKIIHFHGNKPNSEGSYMEFLYQMLKENNSQEAYFYYYEMYCDYNKNVDINDIKNKLVITLLNNLKIKDNSIDDLKNKYQKRYKKLTIAIIINYILLVISFLMS